MAPQHLALLHGFTQTGASWSTVSNALRAAGCATTSPDLPGHGRAGDVRADLWESAQLVADAVGPAVVVGYSMGARLALHVALCRPDVVQGLVLLGGTAGIEDDDERTARRRADEDLAAAIEEHGVPWFLDRWLDQDLFARRPRDPDDRATRLGNTADGLASSLRRCGTGTMDPPLWDRLGEIDVPTLVLAGELDDKFSGLGRRMAGLIGPAAEFAAVPGAGHAAHLEAPDAFVEAVLSWLAGLDR